MDLFDTGRKQLQKENLDRYAKNLIEFLHVANPDIKDIMKALAKHGNANVVGFGEFYVSEKPGGIRCRRAGPHAGTIHFKPGRREVRFRASTILMDMLNQDRQNEDGIPCPNPHWWLGPDEVLFR